MLFANIQLLALILLSPVNFVCTAQVCRADSYRRFVHVVIRLFLKVTVQCEKVAVWCFVNRASAEFFVLDFLLHWFDYRSSYEIFLNH